MAQLRKTPQEYIDIAEKVRSGEFFREARGMYDFSVHDTMAERYFYVLIMGLSGLILFISIIAVNGLYPLQSSIPFIVNSVDISEERPTIHTLVTRQGESPGVALLRFLAQNYVTLREEYDINTFDRNTNGVKSQSTDELFNEYQQLNDPRNPESPIAQYQRHSVRKITVLSTQQTSETTIEATFEALVETKDEIKKSLWQANIAFNYSGVELDETTGKAKPFTFVVTQYKVKRIQEIK